MSTPTPGTTGRTRLEGIFLEKAARDRLKQGALLIEQVARPGDEVYELVPPVAGAVAPSVPRGPKYQKSAWVPEMRNDL